MTAEPDSCFPEVQASLEAAPRGIFQVSPDGGAADGELTDREPPDREPPDDETTEARGRNGRREEPPHLLVRTALVYPGSGGRIAVYVRARGSGYLLTDRGATMAMLGRYLSSDTGDEERWEPAVRKLCDGLGIQMQGREWTVRARRTGDVGEAAMMLAQALLRAAIMAPIFKITRDSRRGNG